MVKIKKTTKKSIVAILLTLLAVGVVGSMFGFLDLKKINVEVPDLGDIGTGLNNGNDVTIPAGTTVQLTGAVMTAAMVDKYELGNEFVPTTVQFRPCGSGSWSSVTSGTTLATPGACYDFYVTNGTVFNNGYFPNKNAPYSNQWILGADDGFILTATSDSSIRIWNDEGRLLGDNASAGVNQTMSSGEDPALQFQLQANSEKSTNPIRCVLENNASVIQGAKLVGPGAVYIGAAKPQSYTISSSQNRVDVVDLPALENGAFWTGTYNIDSKASSDATASFSEVVCFDKQYNIDSDTGAIRLDVETALGTAQFKDAGWDYKIRFD